MTLNDFKTRCDTAAKCLLVAEFAMFPIFLGVANTLLPLIALCWLLAGNFAQRWQSIRANPLTWPALLLYALILLAAIYSSAQWQDILKHYNKYSKLLYCLIFMTLLTDAQWRKRCWLGFAAGMSVVLVSTYANVWIDLPWSATKNQGWGKDHTVAGDYITQNLMMVFFIVLCLAYAHSSVSTKHKIVAYALAVLGGVTILQLSQGRTGFVLLCVGLGIYGWYLLAHRLHWVWKGLICAGAVGLAMAALSLSPIMRDRLHQAYAEARNYEAEPNTAVGARVYRMAGVANLLKENIFLGQGTASYHSVICPALPKQTRCTDWTGVHPDNQYLFFAVDLGLVGLLLFGWFIAVPLWLARPLSNDWKAVYVCFSLMLLLNSLVSSSLWTSRQNHFFVFIPALLAMYAMQRKEDAIAPKPAF
jgi:O-antigen ligase